MNTKATEHDWDLMRSMKPVSDILREIGGSTKDKAPMTVETPFRGSSVGDFCARKLAIESVEGIVTSKSYGPDSQFYFTMGNGIHAAFQQDILSRFLVGAWRCRGCGKVHGSVHDAIMMPSRCDGRVWVSEEEGTKPCPNHNWVEDVVLDWHLPGFEYEELGIRVNNPLFYAHPDGILWRGEGPLPAGIDLMDLSSLPEDIRKYLEVVELKSAGKDAIENGYSGEPPLLVEPSRSHYYQVSTYMYFLGLNRGRIIYINKAGAGWRSSVVEHVIQLDRDHLDREIMDPLRSLYAAIGASDASQAIRRCQSPSCSRAEKCPVFKLCFTDEEDNPDD